MCACGALAVSAGAFSLVSPGHKARIVVAPGEETCVLLAARDLAADVKKYRNGVVRKVLTTPRRGSLLYSKMSIWNRVRDGKMIIR